MRRYLMLMIAILACTKNTRADVTSTFSFDEWQGMVDDFATIDFTGYPDGTPISTQYEGFGVTFAGPSFIFMSSGMVNDGWGLHGPSGLRDATPTDAASCDAHNHSGRRGEHRGRDLRSIACVLAVSAPCVVSATVPEGFSEYAI